MTDLGQQVLAIERAVYARNHKDALGLLIKFLPNTEGPGFGHQANLSDEEFLFWCNRAAAAAAALFCDPAMPVNEVIFRKLSLAQRDLAALFRVTPYRNLDAVAEILGLTRKQERLWRIGRLDSRENRVKLMLTRTPSSSWRFEPQQLFRISPYMAILTCMNLLSSKHMLSVAAEGQKQAILRDALLFADAKLPIDAGIFSRLASAYMFCSYIDYEDKHHIKRHFNQAMQNALVDMGIQARELPSPRVKKDRPRLLIIAELMHSGHAMYRCYWPAIQPLAERFDLSLISTTAATDETVRSFFSDVLIFDFNDTGNVKRAAEAVIERSPDVIYYPSVGMRYFAAFLANLRLAPIQLATLGHPATTFSPCIDYILTQQGFTSDPFCFSETLVLLSSESFTMQEHGQAQRIEPDLRPSPSPLRVAVASASFKLTAPFMALCQRIRQASTRPLEFHFFPNEKSRLHHHAICREIRDWIEDARVYPTTDYNSYIRQLNACDIHLSTYPFGGTNSTIDSMGQGIPAVTRSGTEPHSLTDDLILRRVGAPSWLMTSSEAEMEAAALRLIENDAERLEVGRHLLEQMDRTLFQHENNPHVHEFADAVWWLYQHHESVQAAGKKSWLPEERGGLNT